ncbi:MAG: Ig-like domain-containing protein [Methanobacteriaceae archaeon]
MQKNMRMLIAFTIAVSLIFSISGAVTADQTIEPVLNGLPVANDDCVTTGENTPVLIDVLANDQDPDCDLLVLSDVTNPAHGTVCIIDGKVQYTPDKNWNGKDTFTYCVADGKGGTDTGTVTVICDRAVDLCVSKVDSPDPVVAGGVLTYKVTVTNFGPSSILASDSFIVSDSLPDGFTATSWTPSAGSYDSSSGAWTGLVLASGESATLTVVGTVSPEATGSLTNTVRVTPPEGVTDTHPCNNEATQTTTVTNQAPLSITKTTEKTSYQVGDTVTYTVQVTNQGPSTARNLVITDNVPEGLQYLSSSDGGSYAAGVVTWNLDALNPGDKVTRTVTAKVLPAAAGKNVINTATAVHETLKDPVKTTAKIYVPSADLAITKSVDNPRPMVKDTVVFTLIVNNQGPDTAVDVNVTDKLPAGVSFVSYQANYGSYDSESGLWTIGTLPNGASAVMTITAVAEQSGLVLNEAKVTSLVWDPNLVDNTAFAAMNVQEKVEPVPVNAETVDMEKTGLPIAALLLAAFMLLVGMVLPRRK